MHRTALRIAAASLTFVPTIAFAGAVRLTPLIVPATAGGP